MAKNRVDRDRSGIPVAFPISSAKQTILSDDRTGILVSIACPCDFLPALSDEFQKVWALLHFSQRCLYCQIQLVTDSDILDLL
jgi:hypothetical protein